MVCPTLPSLAPNGACGVVSLLTDFGLSDAYVGSMKGKLLACHGSLRLIDITHGIDAQDVLAASWALHQSWASFPAGTLHLAVVDPGVGSARRILLARDRGHFFLAPDNGLLDPVLSEEAELWAWDAQLFALPTPSHTFHGRDIFAPLAAALASGVEAGQLARRVSDWQPCGFPGTRRVDGGWQTEVLTCDHFGNLITALGMAEWSARDEPASDWKVEIVQRDLPLVKTYADVGPGEAAGLIGSAGTLEISVRDGDARAEFGAERGTPIRLRRRDG